MKGIILFLIGNIALGSALAMDAFSVSVANGIMESDMRMRKSLCIAGVFAGFQFVMPLTGWTIVHQAAERFEAFAGLIPWIAFSLLGFLGAKMIIEAFKGKDHGAVPSLNGSMLFVQGIATSIDALSVGFAISDYNVNAAVWSAVTIGIVTLAICMAGLKIGRRLGLYFADRAQIAGGCILIIIGLRILLRG